MKRLPIEELPADRPECQYCARKLAPVTIDTRVDDAASPVKGTVIRRRFARWNAYGGIFCRLSCALKFAIAAHQAGYRIKKRGR